MKLKITKNILRGNLVLNEGEIYEVDKVVGDSYRIKIPMKRYKKFHYALIKDDEGVLV